MSIAGHVSRAMLSRYSHVRMEAKRRALDEIAATVARSRPEAQGGCPAAARGCGGFSTSGHSVTPLGVGTARGTSVGQPQALFFKEITPGQHACIGLGRIGNQVSRRRMALFW
jgi:hypothetical protein